MNERKHMKERAWKERKLDEENVKLWASSEEILGIGDGGIKESVKISKGRRKYISL